MYVYPNFPTKKAFKDAVKAGQSVSVGEPGLGGDAPANGTVNVEGPHAPKPHTWYARVTLANGKIVKIT